MIRVPQRGDDSGATTGRGFTGPMERVFARDDGNRNDAIESLHQPSGYGPLGGHATSRFCQWRGARRADHWHRNRIHP